VKAKKRKKGLTHDPQLENEFARSRLATCLRRGFGETGLVADMQGGWRKK
jgi:hypothetical protein